MKITTIQVTPNAKSTLAILKYELGCKDYSETIEKLKEIVKSIRTADAVPGCECVLCNENQDLNKKGRNENEKAN